MLKFLKRSVLPIQNSFLSRTFVVGLEYKAKCFTEIQNAKRNFDSNFKLTTTQASHLPKGSVVHIVVEKLDYQSRDETNSSVIDLFLERQQKRLSRNNAAKDKVDNPVITLPGITGCGKSSFLANFPFSPQYFEYFLKRQTEGIKVSHEHPLIIMLTFNSGMGAYGAGEEALGLRILFGALVSMGRSKTWMEFLHEHLALKDMTALEATTLLRSAVGKDRLMLICVDELKKVEEQYPAKEMGKNMVKLLLSQLGKVLDEDSCTDIVVSSLHPEYVRELLDRRDIRYVPILPLNQGELDNEFKSSGIQLTTQVANARQASKKKEKLDLFSERVLQSLHLLASGHARTVEHLKDGIAGGKVLHRLRSLQGRKQSLHVFVMMRELAQMPLFQLVCKEPVNDKEREIVLSVKERNVSSDLNFSVMLDASRCFIVGKTSYDLFRVSTTLTAFFAMLQTIETMDSSQLGTLSRAARDLFEPAKSQLLLSEMWERSHCLTVVSRVHYLRERKLPGTVGDVFGLQDVDFGCDCCLDSNLAVRLASEGDIMMWKANTLFVAPAHHVGFDQLTCVLGANREEVCVYQEVKVCPSGANVNDKSTSAVMADKLFKTLMDHLERNNLALVSHTDQLAALQDVFFVLSMYGCELSSTKDDLKVGVQSYLNQSKFDNAPRAADYDMVLAFVRDKWERNVAFQGTAEIRENMVPVLLPIAQMVQVTSSTESGV